MRKVIFEEMGCQYLEEDLFSRDIFLSEKSKGLLKPVCSSSVLGPQRSYMKFKLSVAIFVEHTKLQSSSFASQDQHPSLPASPLRDPKFIETKCHALKSVINEETYFILAGYLTTSIHVYGFCQKNRRVKLLFGSYSKTDTITRIQINDRFSKGT